MTDSKFPPPPRLPSIPAVKPRGRELEIDDTAPPPDGDLFAEIAELKAALANCGELMTKLATRLSRVQLAMLANEHKSNTALSRSDDCAKRLAAIESKLGMAAE